MKIRTRLLTIQIVLIVIIGTGLGLFAVMYSTNTLTSQLENELMEKSKDNTQYLEERFKRSFAELEGIASHETIRSMDLDEQKKYLEQELKSLDYLTLAIVTPDGTSHYLDGSTADLADRDYIIKAFNGESAMSDVILSRATNELVMMLASPIRDGDNVVGVLIARIDGFYLSDIIDTIQFGETGYAFIVNEDGTFLAHGNRELVETQVNYTEEGGQNAETVTRFISEDKGAFDYEYEGIKRFVAFDTLENGWTFVVGAYEDEIKSEIFALQKWIAIIVISALIIGIVIAYFFANSLSRPIQFVSDRGNEVAKGDFTITIPEKYLGRKDEVGELAQTFNTLTANMREMLQEVDKSALHVEDAVNKMGEQASTTMNLTEESTKLIDGVAETSEMQLAAAEDSAVAMREMAIGTERVAMIATEVSELSNDIHERTNAGEELLHQSVDQMEHIQQGTDSTEEVISKLSDTSEEVNKITQIITDIAEQTNLLALNASIEAARAGEAGTGFAVVAEEIRMLSEQTSTSALDINQLISNIQQDTNSAVSSMEQSRTDVNKGLQLMEDLREDFQTTFRFLSEIHSQMNDLSALAEEMSAGTEEVSTAVEETTKTTKQTTEHMREVTEKSNEQLRTIKGIEEATKLLEETAEQLKQSIDLFKV